jgi:hypothetical protein
MQAYMHNTTRLLLGHKKRLLLRVVHVARVGFVVPELHYPLPLVVAADPGEGDD